MARNVSSGIMQNQRRNLRRLYDPEWRVYLHMFGADTTADRNWAWSGLPSQAAVLQERATARGEPWPFVLVDMEG